MNQKSLKKDHAVKEGKVVVVETVEAEFTKQDLLNEKASYVRKKQQIVQQMQQLKATYEEITKAEERVNGYLKELGKEDIPEIPE
jgi:predicted patatin/cPLA2 family phospholipase